MVHLIVRWKHHKALWLFRECRTSTAQLRDLARSIDVPAEAQRRARHAAYRAVVGVASRRNGFGDDLPPR